MTDFHLRVERLAICQMLVDMMLELRESIFGVAQLGRGDDDTTVMVFCAVAIGHAEGRPMNATKLAMFTHTSRTTVLRKLDRLIGLNLVTKRDRVYLVSPHRARILTATRRARYDRILTRLLRAMSIIGNDMAVTLVPQAKPVSPVMDTHKT
jgi:predicted transcriptional regulator